MKTAVKFKDALGERVVEFEGSVGIRPCDGGTFSVWVGECDKDGLYSRPDAKLQWCFTTHFEVETVHAE